MSARPGPEEPSGRGRRRAQYIGACYIISTAQIRLNPPFPARADSARPHLFRLTTLTRRRGTSSGIRLSDRGLRRSKPTSQRRSKESPPRWTRGNATLLSAPLCRLKEFQTSFCNGSGNEGIFSRYVNAATSNAVDVGTANRRRLAGFAIVQLEIRRVDDPAGRSRPKTIGFPTSARSRSRALRHFPARREQDWPASLAHRNRSIAAHRPFGGRSVAKPSRWPRACAADKRAHSILRGRRKHAGAESLASPA